jgi:hypothetical protein
MNKAQAKKIAYGITFTLLFNSDFSDLIEGWEDVRKSRIKDKDRERILEALKDLEDKLFNKGESPWSK